MEYSFKLKDEICNINCVYMIKNVVNGKVYIGSTVTLKKRIKEHYGLLTTKKHHSVKLQRSWDKHGENNFIISVIEDNIITDEILLKEQYYIDFYLSYKNGYNILPIAGTSKGYKWSENKKKKYSELKKSLKIGVGVIQYSLNGQKVNEYPSILSASNSL